MKLLTDIIKTTTPAVTIAKSNTDPVTSIDISNASYTLPGLMVAGDKSKLDLLPLNQLTRQSHTGFPRTMTGYPADGSPTNYPYAPSSVKVVSNYAYVLILANPGAMAIYDVSDKVNPVLLSIINLANQYNNGPKALYVEPTGRYAYVTMTSFNINIIDTLNKSAPTLVNVNTSVSYSYPVVPYGIREGSIPAAAFTPNAFGAINDVSVSADGRWLYTLDVGASGANCGSGVFVFDLQNLSAPAQKWNILAQQAGGAMGTTNFSTTGPLYFNVGVTSNNSIVMFGSSSDASVPTGVKLYVNSYSAQNCKLFTAASGGGTEIIPANAGTAVMSWRPISLQVVGNYLYVVEFSNTNTKGTPNNTRLIIYDVSNVATSSPVFVGSVNPPLSPLGASASTYGLSVSPDGNFAYISTTTSTMFIVDCTTKATPSVTSSIVAPNGLQISYPKGITVVGNTNQFIWFTTIAGGVTTPAYLYDVSSKSNPILTTSLNIPGTPSTAFTADVLTNTLTSASHGLANGESITCSAIGTVTGISTGQQYYVVNSTTNTIQLALTVGGLPIDLTGANGNVTLYSGTGMVFEYAGYFYVANRALNTLDVFTTLDYTENFGIGAGSSLTLTKSLTVAGTPVATYKADWITADGVTKTINHNLGTLDVRVEIYDKSSGATLLAGVTRTSINQVVVSASEAPGASGWRVIIGTI